MSETSSLARFIGWIVAQMEQDDAKLRFSDFWQCRYAVGPNKSSYYLVFCGLVDT
jgi:hypothetical protein